MACGQDGVVQNDRDGRFSDVSAQRLNAIYNRDLDETGLTTVPVEPAWWAPYLRWRKRVNPSECVHTSGQFLAWLAEECIDPKTTSLDFGCSGAPGASSIWPNSRSRAVRPGERERARTG